MQRKQLRADESGRFPPDEALTSNEENLVQPRKPKQSRLQWSEGRRGVSLPEAQRT